MDFGVHLPLIGFEDQPWSLDRLLRYTESAEHLGFAAVSANDHFVFPRPWLDGPTALAAVLSRTERMTLATTVTIPVVRGPVAVAKTLAAIDLLSGGRLVVGVGPGSSQRDYAALGIPFEERWKRLDESIRALRALWSVDEAPFRGRFYSTEGVRLEPLPARESSLPIWIGSWGSAAGLRRVAKLGDGWLASAYNATPETFADAWQRLQALLEGAGKDPTRFPNAVATMFMFVTEDDHESNRVLRDILVPTINRPEDELRARLLVGSAASCVEKLTAYRAAGAQRVFLWPVRDEQRQLKTFSELVAPLVT